MDLIRRGFLAVSCATLFSSAIACGGGASMGGGGTSTPVGTSGNGFSGGADAKAAPADFSRDGAADFGGATQGAPPPPATASEAPAAARATQTRPGAMKDAEGEVGVVQPKPTDRPGLGT